MDDVKAFGKAVMAGGVAKVHGLERKPGESDEDLAARVKAAKPKRVNKSKPLQRSLAHMNKNGWTCAIVEKYIKHPTMKFGRRIDVFGIGDLLACRPQIDHKTHVIHKAAIALVQCCRDADLAEHRAKILGQPMDHWTEEEREESKEVFAKFKIWKQSGGRVFLQGWGFKGPKGNKKWTLREEEL